MCIATCDYHVTIMWYTHKQITITPNNERNNGNIIQVLAK